MSDIFFGTAGPRDARIVIVGESWGTTEEQQRQPFVGWSGEELTRILGECGIDRSLCFITNVVAEHPPGNEMWQFFNETQIARKEKLPYVRGLYPKENILKGLDLLQQQPSIVKPQIVIA